MSSWSIQELRDNASVLYNHLCSNDADKVYVDSNGHLKVDDRHWVIQWAWPLGDSSRVATDKVALQTLRRVLRALEDGSLDPNKVVIQERNPVGMFMDEEDGVTGSYDAIKKFTIDPSTPLESTARPTANTKWLSRMKFGMNICNASRFKAWSQLVNEMRQH